MLYKVKQQPSPAPAHPWRNWETRAPGHAGLPVGPRQSAIAGGARPVALSGWMSGLAARGSGTR